MLCDEPPNVIDAGYTLSRKYPFRTVVTQSCVLEKQFSTKTFSRNITCGAYGQWYPPLSDCKGLLSLYVKYSF